MTRPRPFWLGAIFAFIAIAVVLAGLAIISRPSPYRLALTTISLRPATDSGDADPFDAQRRDLFSYLAPTATRSNLNTIVMMVTGRSAGDSVPEILGVTFEARVKNQWVLMPQALNFVQHNTLTYTPLTNFVICLVPKGAEACRVHLEYPALRVKLPLRIGDPEARYRTPGRRTAWAQRTVRGISSTLYDWLWPPISHLRRSTAAIEINLPKNYTPAPRRAPSSRGLNEPLVR